MTKLPKLLLLTITGLMVLLLMVRAQKDTLNEENSRQLWSESTGGIEKVLSGGLAGLVADFRVLDVFAIYYNGHKAGKNQDFAYIAPYLRRAQHLDPQFTDVYRLASSLLVFDANDPRAAVEILQKGIVARPYNWEIPFIAGFIAHDKLGDDKLAFELMSQVAGSKGAPLMAITLASRFLVSSSTKEDAILFLKGMLQLVPVEYQEGIKKRIREYRDE